MKGPAARSPSRRRLARARRGVASAVAVTLVILILVFMLAQYLSVTFPSQMQTQELEHTVEVENQFEALQDDIQVEVAHSNRLIPVTAPISLSGQGVPPFGPPSPSSISPAVPSEDNISLGLSGVGGSGLTYPEHYFGGLLDTLNNHYMPTVTFDYEEGALVEGSSTGATMVSGPALVYSAVTGGYAVKLTFVEFLPKNLTPQQGQGTIGIESWLVSETSQVSSAGSTYLNVTTPYSSAWTEWFSSLPQIFPYPPTTHNCYFLPGSLQVCTVQAELTYESLDLTSAVVGVTSTAGA
jgi:hypothetical protein